MVMDFISVREKVRSFEPVQVNESGSTDLTLQLAELFWAFTWMFAPVGSAWTCCQLDPCGWVDDAGC